MIQSTESYLKFHYGLRPKKQIERRMIIDALQIMSRVGFSISDYQYTGFGSVYFIDFIMFHKLLGINRMLSVEHDESIKKRVVFNCPFNNIDIKFGPISNYIPELNLDIKHLIWLDYDFNLNRDILYDASACAAKMPPGSILLITVDNEPPKGEDPFSEFQSSPKESMQYFTKEASNFFNPDWGELSKSAKVLSQKTF